jgi:hypothetical protein
VSEKVIRKSGIDIRFSCEEACSIFDLTINASLFDRSDGRMRELRKILICSFDQSGRDYFPEELGEMFAASILSGILDRNSDNVWVTRLKILGLDSQDDAKKIVAFFEKQEKKLSEKDAKNPKHIAQYLKENGHLVQEQGNDHLLFSFAGLDIGSVLCFSGSVGQNGEVEYDDVISNAVRDLKRIILSLKEGINDIGARIAGLEGRKFGSFTSCELLDLLFGNDLEGPFAKGMLQKFSELQKTSFFPMLRALAYEYEGTELDLPQPRSRNVKEGPELMFPTVSDLFVCINGEPIDSRIAKGILLRPQIQISDQEVREEVPEMLASFQDGVYFLDEIAGVSVLSPDILEIDGLHYTISAFSSHEIDETSIRIELSSEDSGRSVLVKREPAHFAEVAEGYDIYLLPMFALNDSDIERTNATASDCGEPAGILSLGITEKRDYIWAQSIESFPGDLRDRLKTVTRKEDQFIGEDLSSLGFVNIRQIGALSFIESFEQMDPSTWKELVSRIKIRLRECLK